ncbi:MAG: hypothetical protein Tsb006_7560 [Rickettsiaceae bacterium]
MVLDYEMFDQGSATNTGGVTGSKRVTYNKDSKYYQLKPSIKDNSFARRVKAFGTDRENYGEVIASKVGRAILNTDDSEVVPDVSLVYDKAGRRTPVASKYLEGTKVRTLDAFIVERTKDTPSEIVLTDKKHIKFVDGSKQGTIDPAKREYDISGEGNASLRKDIARGIAVSIMTGDHDINPGNFIVTTNEQGENRASRIDFGHAWLDLVNAPAMFGGQVRNNDNKVLDFFNRETVAGLKFGDPSKLWRDYPGMIPTQEMAEALIELSQKDGLSAGINAARQEFEQLLTKMIDNTDHSGIAHLKNTLNAISSNISGSSIDPDLSAKKTIETAFAVIEEFAQSNQRQMEAAGKLMQMQVDIDKLIEAKKNGEAIPQDQVGKIQATYAGLQNSAGIKQENGEINWIKTNAESPAYIGDLNSYIKNRSEQLGLDRDRLRELAYGDFQLPRNPGFWGRIFGNYTDPAVPESKVDVVASAPQIEPEQPNLASTQQLPQEVREEAGRLITEGKLAQVESPVDEVGVVSKQDKVLQDKGRKPTGRSL